MTHSKLLAARGGDVEELVVDHLWLADALAHRLRGRGEDDDDLEQVARCALVEVAQRYDPDRGPFAPYAATTISGVLKRHFRDRGWIIRPPRQTQQIAVRITQQWSDVAQRNRRLPRDEDLAASLGESVAAVREARCAAQGYRAVPIDAPSATGAHSAREDPELEQLEVRLLIQQVWHRLTPDERELMRMRFWERRSQSDIAARIGASQMQVSRLLTHLFTRLRAWVLDGEPEAA